MYVIEENVFLKKYITLQQETLKLGLRVTRSFIVSMHFRILLWKIKIIILKIRTYLLSEYLV